MTSFELNGSTVTVNASADTPLLWVLRDELKLYGTKFGCGAGLCGACTVLLNDQPVRSCVLSLEGVAGKSVVTIEGLGGNHPVQRAWVEGNVSQCGYCQSGQIISAVALLARNQHPTEAEIKTALAGNICRCGTYPRILSAVQVAAKQLAEPFTAESATATRFYDATAVAGGDI